MSEEQDVAAGKLIRDLSRCEHGRHRLDNCFSCPGGQSTGNLFLPAGTRIGTSLYGLPIVAPEEMTERTDLTREEMHLYRNDPRAWYVGF